MERRNFSVKVVITVYTRRRFCDKQEDVYSLLEYLLDIEEGSLYNTQRDEALNICANAIQNQISELVGMDITAPTDDILEEIVRLEAKYPQGIELSRMEKGSYDLRNPIQGYLAMVDPKEELGGPN